MKYIKNYKKYLLTKENIHKVPQTYGIYTFWNKKELPLYVGKSVNIKIRLQSYLNLHLGVKTKRMIELSEYFSYIKVNSELESLLLEARLVRLFNTPYNIELKDDKNPLYIKITKDEYPQVLTARGDVVNNENNLATFGPFTSSSNVKSILKTVRKVFPYAQHKPGTRPCLYSQLGLCFPCPSYVNNLNDYKEKQKLKSLYKNNIFYLKKVLNGNLKIVRNSLISKMKKASSIKDFEKAIFYRNKVNMLNYITQPVIPVEEFLKNPNLVSDLRQEELSDLKKILDNYIQIKSIKRIECFDVAHLAGSSPAASMVTFINGEADRSLYRHFKINQPKSRDDISSLRELAKRRRKHLIDWGEPDLIIVDGGKGQVSVFHQELKGLNIPIIGLAKRFETLIIPVFYLGKLKFNIANIKDGTSINLLQRMRNESHRFARRLHHKLIIKELIPKDID